jgi:ActR/RegA family two-component response regulator
MTQPNRSLLVVDDDVVVADTLKMLLSLKNYAVTVAHDYLTAISLVEKSRFPVAIVDIKLGDDNGLDLIAELKRRFPEIKCIAMTGFVDQKYTGQAAQSGAIRFLEKPFNLDEVQAAINECYSPVS